MEINYEKLSDLMESSIPLKIFRMNDPALALSFLYDQFKIHSQIVIENELMIDALANYLEVIGYKASDENGGMILYYEEAFQLVDKWVNNRFLHKRIDDKDHKVYISLSQYIEKAFQIVSILQEKSFVGTESKFRDIFNKLNELVDNNTENPEKKIGELKLKRDKIDEEISRIQQSGYVQRLEDYQVKSRIDDVARLINELAGDFREVEDNFKKITRAIYEKQETQMQSKGAILNYAFDALDQLKDGDQGKSFYAFWNFLIDDDGKEELNRLIEETIVILDNRKIEVSNLFLKNIKKLLYASGRRVMENNQVLSDRISRMVTERSNVSSKKIRETLAEIQAMVLQNIDQEMAPRPVLEFDGKVPISMIMDRPFSEKEETSVIDNDYEMFDEELDWQKLASLFSVNNIDKVMLRRNIDAILQEKTQVTLKEVIDIHPVEQGLNEIVTYFSIANDMPFAIVNELDTEYMLFDADNYRYIKVPNIIFSK
ncbi:MAG: DUF3375 domain-containing protein [Christensenellaceae bacterium]